jgi:hypothetical protein
VSDGENREQTGPIRNAGRPKRNQELRISDRKIFGQKNESPTVKTGWVTIGFDRLPWFKEF